MRYLLLKKENFNDFISALAKIEKVVAPVSRGCNNFSFAEVKSGKEIALKYIPTVLPPKKYFMPQREKLVEFNKSEDQLGAVVE